MKKLRIYILWTTGILVAITILAILVFYLKFLNTKTIEKSTLLSRLDKAFEIQRTIYTDSSTCISIGIRKKNISIISDFRYGQDFCLNYINQYQIPFDTLEKQKIRIVLKKYLPDSCVNISLSTRGTGALIVDCFKSRNSLQVVSRKFINDYFSDEDVKYSNVEILVYRDTTENIKKFEVK